MNFSKGIFNVWKRKHNVFDDQSDEEHHPLRKWKYIRLNLDHHREEIIHNGIWKPTFHMSVEAFDNLVSILENGV